MRAGAACAALLALGQVAAAPPPLAAGASPTEKDERGLWMQADEAERKLKASNFVIRDPALNGYVRGVFCRTVTPDACTSVRIYLLRSPVFNAAMMPNGAMFVFSGLFLRIQNEAQLAAILGHEYTHFTNRHALRSFRDVKAKSNAAAILSMLPVPGLGAVAAVTVAQFALIGTAFSFSREMEREADAGSVPLMAKAGYDPGEAYKIWEQIRAEADATAAVRNVKSRKDKNGGIFATHPGSAERMTALRELAAANRPEGAVTTGRDAYHQALRDHWPDFVDDQVKLNDLGGTDLLLGQLAAVSGWTPVLLFARGELYRSRGSPADLARAAEVYRSAIAAPDAPIEAWRGLGLALLRTGQDDEGRRALQQYLERRPEAKDRAMITMLAGEQK